MFLFLSDRMRYILKWLLENPLQYICACRMTSVINIYLRRKAQKELQSTVYQRLISWLKPLMLIPTANHNTKTLHRLQVTEDIARLLTCSSHESKGLEFMCFSIIIGSLGSDKLMQSENYVINS